MRERRETGIEDGRQRGLRGEKRMMEAARGELKRSVRVPLDRGWKRVKV